MHAEASSSFSDAIDAIYDAASSPQRRLEALEAIASVFEDVGCLLIFQRFGGSDRQRAWAAGSRGKNSGLPRLRPAASSCGSSPRPACPVRVNCRRCSPGWYSA